MSDPVVKLGGGSVLDGVGGPPRRADVLLCGDRVLAVGTDLPCGDVNLDVDGLYLAPGFVDPHSHSDLSAWLPEPEPFKLLQGVTTEIVGNCGFSFAPLTSRALPHVVDNWEDLAAAESVRAESFGSYLTRLKIQGPTNHIAALVGHGALRLSVNGVREHLSETRRALMLRRVDAAMRHGAFGVSTGLIYVPGSYAPVDELIDVARVAARWGRVYASHMRNEGSQVFESLDETMKIGRESSARVQVSHCKIAGLGMHGNAAAYLAVLDAARREGIDLRGDQYPYTAGATLLSAVLPPVAFAAETRLAEIVKSQDLAYRDLQALAARGGVGAGLWSDCHPESIHVVAHVNDAYHNRTLAQISGRADPFLRLCQLVVEDPAATTVLHMMAAADVHMFGMSRLIGPGSDSGLPDRSGHPRTWGTFPRYFQSFVRDEKLLTWGEAVRKATSMPARHFGLPHRGILAPGWIADLVAFDPTTIGHSGDYQSPGRQPTGVVHVFLAGVQVVRDGGFLGVRAGRVLRPGVAH